MRTLDFAAVSLADYLASVEVFQLVLLGVVEHACYFEVALRLLEIMFVIEILNELVSEFIVLIVSQIYLLIVCVAFIVLSTSCVLRLQGCKAGVVFGDGKVAIHLLEALIGGASQVVLG